MRSSDFNQGNVGEKAYKIIVCGGRHFENYTLLETIMKNYLDENSLDPTDVEIVSGHCQGADMLGERYAEEHGCALTVFRAEWKKYGKAAGPIRNKQMVDYIANAEKKTVIAFVSENTRGTQNTVSYAKRAGIPVIETRYVVEAQNG